MAASLLDPRRAAWDTCWLEALAAATGAVPAMLARSSNARALNKGFILVLWTMCDGSKMMDGIRDAASDVAPRL